MAKRSDFRVLVWIPTAVKEIEHELNDRELVFAWLIYTIHKNRHRAHRKSNDVYHIANNDFQNIMGWTSFMYKWNEALEPLRKIFRIGQKAGYWEVQFRPETMVHAGNPPGKTSPKYEWTYLKDPQAIAIHFYIQAVMHQNEIISDWHEGQDLKKFYSKSVLPKATYDIMKFRKHLYYNDDC